MLLYLFIELSLRFFTMQPKIIRCKTCDLIVIFIVDPSQLWINEIPSPFRNLHLWNLHLPLITRQNQEGRGWILIDMRLNISFSKYYKEHHFMCILFLDISHCQDEFSCMKLSILKIFFGAFRITMMCSTAASKMIWDSRRENQLQPVSFTNAFSIGEYLRLKEQLFLTS